MRKTRILILMIVLSLTFTGCQKSNQGNTESPAPVIEETTATKDDEPAEQLKTEEKKRLEGPFKEMIAPDFTLNDIEGNEVTLSDLKGNAVALIFWTSW